MGNSTDELPSGQTDFTLKTSNGSRTGNLSSDNLEDSDDVAYYVNSSSAMDFGVKVSSTVSSQSTSVTKVPTGNDASDERVESYQWMPLPWSEVRIFE